MARGSLGPNVEKELMSLDLGLVAETPAHG
jgi:hypothetical protein